MKQIVVDNIGTTYFITEDGKCYNSITNKYLKGQINYRNGYKSYNLTLPNGAMKRLYAHRLVAIAFIPNPENKPEVNHIDGNKQNNCFDNLEWVSSRENKKHAIDTELRSFKHVFCFSKNKELVAEYKNIQEAASAVGISSGRIVQEVGKPTKELTNGFYWSYEPTLGLTKTYANTGKAKPVYQYDKNGKYIMNYPSASTAARAVGGTVTHVSECCRGKIKSYKGFVFRYKEDIVSPSNESWSAPQEQ